MEQNRDMLLSNDSYVRSKYQESTSLSNKKAYQNLNLCKVVDNKEVYIVMNLSHEDAREYEIKLLMEQLKDINENIKAVDYFLSLSDFRGCLMDLKEAGDIDINSENGNKLYRALSKFDFVYKYNNMVGVMGKVDSATTSGLYQKLEGYKDKLVEEFNNPVISLNGATWIGVAAKDTIAHIVITLKSGATVTVPETEGIEERLFGDGISDLKDAKGKRVIIRNSEIAMITVE